MFIKIEERMNLTLVIDDKSIYSDIQLNPEIKYMLKAMDFYQLLKLMGQNLSSKYEQKFFDSTKKLAIDILRTTLIRVI